MRGSNVTESGLAGAGDPSAHTDAAEDPSTHKTVKLVAAMFLAALALFAVFSAFTGGANAMTRTGGTGTTDPWVSSDMPDYPPGATVGLLGGNWQAGESVHIYVNDSDGQTWAFNDDVTADSSGNISDSFNLPNWFVANYSVTATGASGSVATTTFTDAIQTATTIASSLNPSNFGDSVTFTATVTCNQTCTFGATNSFDFVENANQNCNGGTTLGSTSTLTGSGLTRQGTFTTSSLTGGTHSIRACFRGGGSNPNPASSTSGALSQVVNSCSPPAITTQPSDQSVTYSANASFTAAASGASPSVQWQVSTDGGTTFTNVAGATTATLNLTKPRVSVSGNKYRAVFTNGCGSAASNAATLTVTPKNLTVTGITASNKVYDGLLGATINTTSAPSAGSSRVTPSPSTPVAPPALS